jgi:hypothetical protein
MQPAVIPQSMIAERRRLGLDQKDEMWEGVLHMNEPGSVDHQSTESDLIYVLRRVATQSGLLVLPETGVFDPSIPGYKDFRTPDVLVVEIRSPGDESFEKIDEVPFGPNGWDDLQAIPVALRGSAGGLEVRIDGQVEAF